MFPTLSSSQRAFAAVVIIAIAVAGFVFGLVIAGTFDDGDATPAAVGATPAPASSTIAVSPKPRSTPAPASSTPAAATALPPRPSPLPPTATPTVDFMKQPEVQILVVTPPLGTHIEEASVEIAIDVRYQGGRDSNVLAWELYYCAAPTDCNTYGSRNETEVIPGAAGVATIGGPFPAGGNYLRPIVVCRYTVAIGHFLTPEAQWQTQLSDDPRCQSSAAGPAVRVLDVAPELGAAVVEGDTISINLSYEAGPATQVWAGYYVAGCGGDLFAARTIDIAPGTSGVATINIAVTAESAGILSHIEARLLNGGLTVASYAFGPC